MTDNGQERRKGRRIVNRAAVLLAQKAHREQRKLTLQSVHEATGLFHSTLSPIFNNEAQRYDLNTLLTLFEYLECASFDEFFEIVETNDEEGEAGNAESNG